MGLKISISPKANSRLTAISLASVNSEVQMLIIICLRFVSDQLILVPKNQSCYSQKLQINTIDKRKWSVIVRKSFTLNLILFFEQTLRLTSFSLSLFFSVYLQKNSNFVKKIIFLINGHYHIKAGR